MMYATDVIKRFLKKIIMTKKQKDLLSYTTIKRNNNCTTEVYINHINSSVQSLVLKIKLLLPYKNVNRFLQSLIYSILLVYNLLILFISFVFLIMS